MSNLIVKTDHKIEEIFSNYPDPVKDCMLYLRQLVRETAEETAEVPFLEETLKWGEPSFITEKGSTLRMDWKPKLPNQYALYFQCTSRLVDTFKLVYGHKFQYEGTRAITFQLNQKIPIKETKECIKAALIYHTVKHLVNLGI